MIRGGTSLELEVAQASSLNMATLASWTHLLALIGVLVRVVLQGQLPVGLLQLVLGGLGVHTQQVVVGRLVDHGVSLAGAQCNTV